jgi:hypothetical protein
MTVGLGPAQRNNLVRQPDQDLPSPLVIDHEKPHAFFEQLDFGCR